MKSCGDFQGEKKYVHINYIYNFHNIYINNLFVVQDSNENNVIKQYN